MYRRRTSETELFRADVDTPVGPVAVIFTADERCRGVTFHPPKDIPHAALPNRLTPLADFLKNFPNGSGLDINSNLFDLDGVTPFRRAVYAALADVAPGQVITYGALAENAGSPKAFRAVGGAMANNPLVLVIPCHRVVASSGIGGFSSGLPLKRRILAIEGNARFTAP